MLIAFTGERGCGKSEAALVAAKEYGAVDIKFADPLKNMLRAMYQTCGLHDKHIEARIEGDLKEVGDGWLLGQTPRLAMQTLGTEWRDLIDPNMWSLIFLRRVKAAQAAGKPVVCSDYRFPHEALVLEAMGFTAFRVIRPTAHYTDEAAGKHASESHYGRLWTTGTLHNDGSLSEFRAMVRDTLEGYA